MLFYLSAKPRPSKKARLNKTAEDNTAAEPERIPDPAEANLDDVLNAHHHKTLLLKRNRLTPQALLISRPALFGLINRLVQQRILTNRQPQYAPRKKKIMMCLSLAFVVLNRATLLPCQNILQNRNSLRLAKANGVQIYQHTPL